MFSRMTAEEYSLLREYIVKHCDIPVEAGREDFLAARLSELVLEADFSSFADFQRKATGEEGRRLRDRIVDLMTSKETYWFRDTGAWDFLREVEAPRLFELAARGKKLRVWSAACSTGQEAYSLAILLAEEAEKQDRRDLLQAFEIIATDISSAALFVAISGRYDKLEMEHGLTPEQKERFFTWDGRFSALNEQERNRVRFRKFNLQDSFSRLGEFDLVLTRYVIHGYTDRFKRELARKTAGVLHPGGVLLLGATENLRGLTGDFNLKTHSGTIYYQRK